MKFKRVQYGAKVPIYGDGMEMLMIETELDDSDDFDESLAMLKKLVHERLNDWRKYDAYETRFTTVYTELKRVEEALDNAYKQWQTISDFMAKQGLDHQLPTFPHLEKSLSG